jgi:hypothetical protein
MGVWSAQVCSSVEFGPQLDEALHVDGPALVEIDMQAVGPSPNPFATPARAAR